jgi:hypothetical protein
MEQLKQNNLWSNRQKELLAKEQHQLEVCLVLELESSE